MFLCRKIPYFFFPLLTVAAVIVFSFYLLSASFCAVVNMSADTSNIPCADIPVLMYHSLADSYSRAGDYVFPPDEFRRDMEYLKKNGFETVSVSQVYDFAVNGTALPEKPIMITFDDGFLNVLTYALPIFRELDMCGVMNPVGYYSEKSEEYNEHEPLYSYLTFDEITELAVSGRFEIGSHTYNMHSLDGRKGCGRKFGESSEEYKNALIADSRKMNDILLEKCGITTSIFAYPYGFISDESEEILNSCGYNVFFTCFERHNRIYPKSLESKDSLILDRYNRYFGSDAEEFMLSAGIV